MLKYVRCILANRLESLGTGSQVVMLIISRVDDYLNTGLEHTKERKLLPTRSSVKLDNFASSAFAIDAHLDCSFLSQLQANLESCASPFLEEGVQSLRDGIAKSTPPLSDAFRLRKCQSVDSQGQTRFCIFLIFVWVN